LGGNLRVIGWNTPPRLVPVELPILVDEITGSGFSALHSVIPYDGDAAFGVYPYVVVQKGASYEHHWIRPQQATTKIDLPFQPGPAAVKIASKIAAVPSDGGSVRFSSTLNGPTDWTEEADAGFLPVVKHASGDRTVNGLGFYDNLLAVIFDDSVQLWEMSPDPSLNALARVLNGVGTPYVKTAVNVRGDLIYLSRSGFIDLHTVTTTGLIESDHQIGAPIEPLTTALDVARTLPISVWWGEKSQYVTAIGSTMYAYTEFAGKIHDRKGGWLPWTAPASVDAMCTHLGKLYIRCGNIIYTQDDDYADGTSFSASTQFLVGKYPGRLKTWLTADSFQVGNARTKLYPSKNHPTDYEQGPDLLALTDDLADIPIIMESESLSVEMFGDVAGGDDRWRLDQLVLTYDPMKG
jgi:hypothetical protein